MTISALETPSTKIRRTPASTPGGSKVQEENILVTVRMRPLSSKELASYELVAWDIPDEHTIVSKNLAHDRNAGSGSYMFDKVFGPTCSTSKVYEAGARDVALSALSGINATIFAYGQTSSGKTFTMQGITEFAVKEIYEHINNTQEREFSIKFSAMEIYNETVIDLLNKDSGSLRLLDDHERGTVVDKLTEETISNPQHLKHLIGVCEAQRQVGETALNDKSSRSHQIIRLTIESSLRDDKECIKSFLASLNLVDLAGSERAAQANTVGMRLKEGSHINKSLLTLTTVIRKLSSGNKSGHIPYRNSKLTRILQTSLGGNARTAIICTMSPALVHMEQSRNTLLFATNAKEVRNNAQVNMIIEKKELVKHLQQEVARLEAELRSPDLSSTSLRHLLMEKDLKIQQMEREINELKLQRDQAQSQLDVERSSHKETKASENHGHSSSSQVVKRLSFNAENDHPKNNNKTWRKSSTSTGILVTEIRKLELRQKQLGDEANRALDLLHKEVTSQKLGTQDTAETIAKMLSEIKAIHATSFAPEEFEVKEKKSSTLREEIARLNSHERDITMLEEKLENVQRSIDKLLTAAAGEEKITTTPDFKNSVKKKKGGGGLPFAALSNAANVPNILRSPCSPKSSCKLSENEIENRSPANGGNNINGGSSNGGEKKSSSMSVKKMQKMFKKATEDNIQSIKSYVTELKERVAKLQYQKQLLVCQVLELEEGASTEEEAAASTGSHRRRGDDDDDDRSPWPEVFEEQRKEIIMLWHLCHVSIIHRTQFYLLFRGDPSDQIYMEVEIRRLKWLEQHLDELGNASPALLGDDPPGSVTSSIKALRQEREYLAKRVSSKLTAEEREALYAKWEVPAEGKQRRLHLVNRLWTDPLNMAHVRESAEVVAKLVGFCESSSGGQPLSREMFELSFVPLSDKKTWMGWNLISNLLHL